LNSGGEGVKIPESALDGLRVGLSWESPTDLDSSILVVDNNYAVIDAVWWNNL